ncbi:MAG: hypothetical protein ACD_52C00323G0003 [uncultured bacterium]|uniref:Uncharacterized protein n=1 Tax=Candidatus Woesebacteria bacterium RIFCSPHIGHO2_12_FULL_41_24 TaxID=1802510 RepID=A0A1F8AW73_9BACT|nr:MAG: hypothetical protein ACD_52C00323G0003 [uncultured bacterium]OGM14833.1 MAG: hypothetical protein A2W15_00645 [Candidatus Woesebacteria bacterium RBG_16_41_13]OGM30325.1 MAG: hypothetical protein A2873_05350 [Candidatus Woesebacteria bacterium RIFCSPHIGHO2_01_FULL_42_80]OGM34364.1 MAG: hypothetical protein A3D84_04930 [Candidatus Woesebacteria bacterium RIFCSPHIGHO2_02_FULL_42_20]OGM55498.1 MAG: hypothetical protein A3E44_01085 [Candidatus Woesebacteria bacterium RIFCSPHIGHO2_12_FULL_41
MITIYENIEGQKRETQLNISPKSTNNISNVLFSPFGNKFLNDLTQKTNLDEENEMMVRVSEALGGLVYIYERIRNVIEYKGENVLRRSSIERMIKRLLWERPRHNSLKVAEALIKELIWSRYLPNNKVPHSKITQIAEIVEKYKYLIATIHERGTVLAYSRLREWVWGIASCEIEEALQASKKEEYVELMHSWFLNYYDWTDNQISDHEKDIQIYLAVHRSLVKSDEAIMRYHLVLKEIPNWTNAKNEDVDRFTKSFSKMHEEIEDHLSHPNRMALFRVVQKHAAPFLILREFIEREGDYLKILQDPAKFESSIYELCEINYAKIRNKVNRGIVRSILYIFVTKIFIAFLLETPYELLRFGALRFIPLAINISVPPLMMTLIGLTIRIPSEQNSRRILNKLKTIIYTVESPTKQKFSLKKASRSGRASLVFSTIYLVLFLLVFGGVSYLLFKLDFTILAILIFFMFVSMVLLFGSRVRFTASQLSITPEREGLIKQIIDNLSLPFLSMGVYLSKGIAKLNFLTILLDFLIEAPLKIIVEVIEEWTSFIREKREEVVEVPEQ